MGLRTTWTGISKHNPIVLDDSDHTVSVTVKQPATREITRVPRTSKRDDGSKRKFCEVEHGRDDMCDMSIKEGKRKPVCNKSAGNATPEGKSAANKEREKRLKRFAPDQIARSGSLVVTQIRKRYREKAPLSFHEISSRALSQRMIVLDRERLGTHEKPEEVVHIAGSTGNVYVVTIAKVPACSCPHALKGNQCKHIVYVLTRTLKAPDELRYQLAFLNSELRTIFDGSPPLPAEVAKTESCEFSGKRKAIEDDCPICCDAFDVHEKDDIVWCRAACGNNVHRTCFEEWAKQKKSSSGGGVTCPFCRTPWQGNMDSIKHIVETGTVGSNGYVNVGTELGLPTLRDYSTYHPFWVRKQFRQGHLFEREDYYDVE